MVNKTWKWCETRPDIIVGFVPNQNFYSLGTVLGVYLSLYREVRRGDTIDSSNFLVADWLPGREMAEEQ
jgi:hypothetical protein